MNQREETVKLEKIRVATRQRVSEEVLRDVKVDVITDLLTRSFVFEFRSFVWAEEERVHQKTVMYPKDWWEAVKERWLPVWALRKWHVKYKAVVVDVLAIYPNFSPAVKDEQVILHPSSSTYETK